MSTFILTGFFGLLSGRRVRSEVTRSDGSSQTLYHVHYITSVTCSTSSVSADLRKYSPPNDIILRDNTIAFLVAKCYIPPANVPGNILLEAIHIAAVPGDPSSPGYEDSVPDFPFPAAFAQGLVTGDYQMNPEKAASFSFTLSDYVRGQTRQSAVTHVTNLIAILFNS
jgi:hypothetical protein